MENPRESLLWTGPKASTAIVSSLPPSDTRSKRFPGSDSLLLSPRMSSGVGTGGVAASWRKQSSARRPQQGSDYPFRTKAATSPRRWPARPMRPKSPAHRRMLARQRAVQERPTAYAESPRPLRHEGPTDRSAACPPGDRNVAEGIARSETPEMTKALAAACLLSAQRAIHLSQVVWAGADGWPGLPGLLWRAVGVVSGRARVHRLLGVVALAGRVSLPAVRESRRLAIADRSLGVHGVWASDLGTAGTIFHLTRTPLPTWFAAAWLMTAQKQGVSALGLQRSLGHRVLPDGVGRCCTGFACDGPSAETPWFCAVISHAAANHVGSGVRVRWKIVPAVTEV